MRCINSVVKIIRYIKSNVNILYMKVYFRVISLIVENKGFCTGEEVKEMIEN